MWHCTILTYSRMWTREEKKKDMSYFTERQEIRHRTSHESANNKRPQLMVPCDNRQGQAAARRVASAAGGALRLSLRRAHRGCASPAGCPAQCDKTVSGQYVDSVISDFWKGVKERMTLLQRYM